MQRNIRTVAQFSERNPAITQPAVRWLIFKEHENGLAQAGAVVRRGRRVYIDEDRFFDWLNAQQQHAA